MKHYIAKAGMGECPPSYCEVFESASEAAEALVNSLDLINGLDAAWLRSYWFIELDPERDGNEYASIEECWCAEPWVHREEWARDRKDG